MATRGCQCLTENPESEVPVLSINRAGFSGQLADPSALRDRFWFAVDGEVCGNHVFGVRGRGDDRLQTSRDAVIDMRDLNIAEIPFENGGIRYRYARKMSADNSSWIREGPFQAFHQNGALASDGTYVAGFENGQWRDFHENGQLAAEGCYDRGAEVGTWRFWNADGTNSTDGS